MWPAAMMYLQCRNVSPVYRFVAGSLAGTTASMMTYPLDIARARMAVTQRHTYARTYHFSCQRFVSVEQCWPVRDLLDILGIQYVGWRRPDQCCVILVMGRKWVYDSLWKNKASSIESVVSPYISTLTVSSLQAVFCIITQPNSTDLSIPVYATRTP